MQCSGMNAYQDGCEAADSASRACGGSHGAEWLAGQRGLIGADREEFIRGYDDTLGFLEEDDQVWNEDEEPDDLDLYGNTEQYG